MVTCMQLFFDSQTIFLYVSVLAFNSNNLVVKNLFYVPSAEKVQLMGNFKETPTVFFEFRSFWKIKYFKPSWKTLSYSAAAKVFCQNYLQNYDKLYSLKVRMVDEMDDTQQNWVGNKSLWWRSWTVKFTSANGVTLERPMRHVHFLELDS